MPLPVSYGAFATAPITILVLMAVAGGAVAAAEQREVARPYMFVSDVVIVQCLSLGCPPPYDGRHEDMLPYNVYTGRVMQHSNTGVQKRSLHK